MEIYRNLLLQTGGDVDEALRWMEHFGEQYGFFNDKFGIDDFKKLLEESGEAERTPQGFEITPQGRAAHPPGLAERDLLGAAGRRRRATTARRSRARAASGSPRRGPTSSATTSRNLDPLAIAEQRRQATAASTS